MATSSFTCQICDSPFPSRNALFRHLRIHEDKEKVKERRTETSECEENSVDSDGASVSQSNLGSQIVIVSEDDWYRVIIKPQGMSTMGKKNGSNEETLTNSDYMLLPNYSKDNVSYKKARPCHRLDSATGGLVVCAKSHDAERYIKIAFMEKDVKKRYRAIVQGRLEPDEGEITLPLSGQESLTLYKVTHYTPSLQYGWITTVDLFPVTGRKHQLRKHLQALGHPILGDRRYSFASTWPKSVKSIGGIDLTGRLFLHSLEVNFPHPEDKHREKILSQPSARCVGTSEEKEEGKDGGMSNVNIRRVEVCIQEPQYYHDFRQWSEKEYEERGHDVKEL